VATFFRCFYNGFTQEKTVWYAYYCENNTFELPVKFGLESVDTHADSMTNFGEAITPGILPVDFFIGRSHQPSYEFYYPSVAARQLGFGQLPVRLFFTDLVKPRETISNLLEYDRLKNLVLDAETIDLEGWIISSFTTKPFRQWWLEWGLHLFCASAKTYCQQLDPDFIVPDDEVTCFLLFHKCYIKTLPNIPFPIIMLTGYRYHCSKDQQHK
jgi:hypothetical protein